MSTKGNYEPGQHDVLCGRGASTNTHPGNVSFRALVAEHQPAYILAKKEEKEGIARSIISIIQGRGGKFVMKRQDSNNDVWVPVDEKKAVLKTSQALREGMNVRKTTSPAGSKASPVAKSKKSKTNHPQPVVPRPPRIHTPTSMPTGSPATNETLTENDVLCGRGGGTNAFVGNIKFRAIVAEHQPHYLVCKRAEKETIAAEIVQTIRQRGGRFLSKNEDCQWEEVGDKKAILKCSQALREGMNVRGGTLKSPERESKFAAALVQERPPPPPPPAKHTATTIMAQLSNMPRPQLEAVARAMLCSGSSEAIDAALNAMNSASL